MLNKYRVVTKDHHEIIYIDASHFYVEGDVVIFEEKKDTETYGSRSVAAFHSPVSVTLEK